ncbi:MAG: CHASE domain-containing protein [Rhodospirillales bacterium]|nr:CHASE domain-containing protein [Rhodospirillales bacterium]
MEKLQLTTLQRFGPPGLVLTIGLLFSFAFFNELIDHNRGNQDEAFREAAQERIAAVGKRISSELTVLRSIVGFFQGSNYVDPQEFHTFVNTMMSSGQSFQALEWIPRITADQREAFIKRARDSGYSNFFIKEKNAEGKMIPAAARNEYFPVYYVEPYKGNEEAHGFDLASNQIRLAAIEQARDSGQMVVSSRINLVQMKENNAGVLVFAPIFTKDSPHETLAQRRQNLAGFALGVIRVSGLISGLYSEEKSESIRRPAGIDLYVFEEDRNQGHAPLYIHSSRSRNGKAPDLTIDEARQGIVFERPINVGGRIWTLIARPVKSDLGGNISIQNWFVLLASLLVTGLVCAYVVSVSRRARTVENMVRQRTLELNEATQQAQDRESRISVVLDTVVDGIVTIDDRATIESFNPAAATIFGYTVEEMMGENLGLLMAEPYRSMHESYAKKFQETGNISIVGRTQEIIGARKDGSTFPMEMAIGEMRIGAKRMFTGIFRDITDRKQAEKSKADFVSTVSHELRTPLTSIKGALGLIRSNTAGELPDSLKSMFEIAYSNSDRLVRLINDILDVEKISAGKMEYQMGSLDLIDLLEQSVAENKGFGDENGVRFNLTMEVGNSKINGDPGRLMQVFANLLSNAAKFSPENEIVKIELTQHGQWQRISVRDNGPGIPEDFRDKIFERFSQADSSDTRQKGGTGLGLNISKSIVEAHGGMISFETEIGKGTTFILYLPNLLEREEQLADIKDEASSPRILICEDEKDIATLLELMLKQDGYHTDTARNAAQASSLMQNNDYDAITLDIGLPDLDGISLIREIRENPKTRDLPIIVVSAMASEGKKSLNGDAIGIIDWIEKPINQKRLSERLSLAISRSSKEKPNILHVEDDPDILEIVSELVAEFADVVPAMTLAEANKLLKNQEFDLVILDLILPDGLGDDLLPLINQSGGSPTPVIVFSAKEVSGQGSKRFMASLIKSQTTNEKLIGTIRSVIKAGQQGTRTI